MLRFGFFDSIKGDRKYNSRDVAELFDGLIVDGIYAQIGERFSVNPKKVIETEEDKMTVTIGTGQAWLSHTKIVNTSKYELVLNESVGVNRYDAIIIEVNDNTRMVNIFVKKNVKTKTENDATRFDLQDGQLVRTEFIHQYLLAVIFIEGGVTKITQGDIASKIGFAIPYGIPYVTCPLDPFPADETLKQWIAQWSTFMNNSQTRLDNFMTGASGRFNDFMTSSDNSFKVAQTQRNTDYQALRKSIVDWLNSTETDWNAWYDQVQADWANFEDYVDDSISEHNKSNAAHQNIQARIDTLTTRLNTLADSDDSTLDQLSEIVAFVKENREMIDSFIESGISVNTKDKPGAVSAGGSNKFKSWMTDANGNPAWRDALPTQRYYDGTKVSINNITDVGMSRIYVQSGSNDHNYLGFYGNCFIINSLNVGFLYQIIFEFGGSNVFAWRRNVTQNTITFDYTVPLYKSNVQIVPTITQISSSWIDGNKGSAIINSTSEGYRYTVLAKMISTNGVFTIGKYTDKFLLNYTSNSTIEKSTNSTDKSLTLLDESGDTRFPGTLFVTAGLISAQDVKTNIYNHAISLGRSTQKYTGFFEYFGEYHFYKSVNGVNTLITKIGENEMETHNLIRSYSQAGKRDAGVYAKMFDSNNVMIEDLFFGIDKSNFNAGIWSRKINDWLLYLPYDNLGRYRYLWMLDVSSDCPLGQQLEKIETNSISEHASTFAVNTGSSIDIDFPHSSGSAIYTNLFLLALKTVDSSTYAFKGSTLRLVSTNNSGNIHVLNCGSSTATGYTLTAGIDKLTVTAGAAARVYGCYFGLRLGL